MFFSTMDYEIIEQFNRFWRNYRVDETLFPRRRAATLKLWIDKHPLAREAMLAEVEANGGPKGKNPYFYVQEFADPEPTNYNGRRLKPGVTYVIAKYKGSYGTYTLAEAEQFGMEIKYGMNFDYKVYLEQKAINPDYKPILKIRD